MRLEFEYGEGKMAANLPDNTDVFIPGETVKDPPCLPQDWDSLYKATLDSIRNPIGMPALRDLAKPDSKVVFVIPDIVKGGCQATSHRKISIRACLDELYSKGVKKENILLLISNGLHPRATVGEMKKILGDDLFNEFYYISIVSATISCPCSTGPAPTCSTIIPTARQTSISTTLSLPTSTSIF